MLYIHEFQTQSEFEAAYNGTGYTAPWVSYTVQNSTVNYNKDPFNGHAYVDLGLASGTLWATCNVGATNPEDYGGYYAWGEVAEKSGDNAYTWDDYAWGTSSSNLTKYNNTDGKRILDPEDDVAHVVMGGDWCLPTSAQCAELCGLTSTWKTVNGVEGREFVGNNGNTLFIPAAGYKHNGSLYDAGRYCYLWSASLNSGLVDRASCLYSRSDYVSMYNYERCSSNSYRGVINQS